MAHADAYGASVFADTPTAWYRLDETSGTAAADEMGGAAGTHTGGVVVNQSAVIPTSFGKSALYASGFGASTTATTLGTLGTNIATASFEFWIKTTTAATVTAVFGQVNSGSSMIVQCLLNSANQTASAGRTELYIRNSTASGVLEGSINYPALYDGNAHHVVWVVTSTTTLACYVDGVSQAVTYVFQVPLTGANFDFAMAIGGRNNRGAIDRLVDATLDEVAFYPTQLSQARVSAHYAAAQVPAGPASGTVGRRYVDQPGVFGAGRRR